MALELGQHKVYYRQADNCIDLYKRIFEQDKGELCQPNSRHDRNGKNCMV